MHSKSARAHYVTLEGQRPTAISDQRGRQKMCRHVTCCLRRINLHVYRLITIAINAPFNCNKAYVYPYVTSQEERTAWQLHGICRALSSATIVDAEWIVKLTYKVCAGIQQLTSTLDHPHGNFESLCFILAVFAQ